LTLQLLDSEQLEYAFAVHGISRETQARRFYADLWGLIQGGEKIRDPLSLSKIESGLRRLCRDYFSLMHVWQEEEADRHDDIEPCAASQGNSREARILLSAFEKNFVRYALCYLELNRTLIQSRNTLSHFARGYRVNNITKKLDVSHETGPLLQRAHRERKIVMEKRLRLERARNLLRGFDPLMESLGGGLPRLMGHAGDHELILFKGALRKRKFDDARAITSRWPEGALRQAGDALIAMAEKNADELQAQDGLLLHSGELPLITMFLQADEARVNRFLDKYNVPYMVFKYRALLHQGYMLGRIGSIEALIIQHAKLLSLSARPHADPDAAKAQEDAVLVPARALQDRFKTLPAIFDEMETTVAILEKLFSQTREYMAHTPENNQN
jgi:hypothetical protein